MSEKKGNSSKNQKQAHETRWAFLRRPPVFLDLMMARFESPKILKRIEPHVKKGQVVADLGCGWGFYAFALADLVGPDGNVYAVDLSKNCIRSIQKKAEKFGYQNIKAFSSTAADLSFIADGEVDFVFTNGLLCSMVNNRPAAVSEIRRILKSNGKAYISLGAAPPFGLVDESEWTSILDGFKINEGGDFKSLWAIVSQKAA